jgi:chromosome segregation ATPase
VTSTNSDSCSGSSDNSCIGNDTNSSVTIMEAELSDCVLSAVTDTTERATAAFNSSTIGGLGEHSAAAAADSGSANTAVKHNDDSVCLTTSMLQQQQQCEQSKRDADKIPASDERALLDEHIVSSAEAQMVSAAAQVAKAIQVQSEIDVLKQLLTERDNTNSSLSQQLHSEHDARAAMTVKLSALAAELVDAREQLTSTAAEQHARAAKEIEMDCKLRDIVSREAQITAVAEKTENIKRELRTLRKRDAEHAVALQQCRDTAVVAVAAAAAATTQLQAVQAQLTAATAQLDELEERSTCVVCQCEAKTVLLQPCLHLCLCTKCSTSPKLKDCPICRATIDYKETVHLC